MTPEEADQARSRLRRSDPRYCNQWNQPPTRYAGEGGLGKRGTVTLQSGCGYPSTWEVRAYSTVDYSCDVHLSQAVRGLAELEGLHIVLTSPRDPA